MVKTGKEEKSLPLIGKKLRYFFKQGQGFLLLRSLHITQSDLMRMQSEYSRPIFIVFRGRHRKGLAKMAFGLVRWCPERQKIISQIEDSTYLPREDPIEVGVEKIVQSLNAWKII